MIQTIHDVDFWVAYQTTSFHLYEDCKLLAVARHNGSTVAKLQTPPYHSNRVRCALCEARMKEDLKCAESK